MRPWLSLSRRRLGAAAVPAVPFWPGTAGVSALHPQLVEADVSPTMAVLAFGLAAVALVAFAFLTIRGVRSAGQPVPVPALHAFPAGHQLRVLVAVDGSPFSDCAVDSVARRPWPQGTQVEVLSVVHTRLPLVPEPFLTGAAAHVDTLEADRRAAPGRVRAAQERLAAMPGPEVEGQVLEGEPADVIVAEAARWHADLVVLGTHGRGGVKRLALGSVSEAVVRKAPCSVEVVRCHEAA
jgi:nucleotide-binding universal stress UspA family protein